MQKMIVLALLVAALTLPVFGSELVAPSGYAVSEIALTGYIGGFDLDSDGNFIVLHGSTLDRITPGGSVTNLYTYSPTDYTSTVYGSFVRVDAAAGKVYFGESTKGWVKSIGLDGTNPADIVRAPGNYDFDLAGAGKGMLVAGSNIYQLDLATGSVDTIVANASPWSGPVTLDSAGNLYYGTSGTYTGDSEWILKWTAAQVAGAVGSSSLGVGDASKLANNLPGVGGFGWNGSDLLFTANVWDTSYKLFRYSGGAATEFAVGNSWLSMVRVNPTTGAISVLAGNTISTLTPVPEPGALLALAFGIGALVMRRKR